MLGLAGILPTTDLGYPLAGTPATSNGDVIINWDATSRVQIGFGESSDDSPFNPDAIDFTLRVNLTDSTITALIRLPDPNPRYLIIKDQPYDERGVITGTIDYAGYGAPVTLDTYEAAVKIPFDSRGNLIGSTGGALTGLIGQGGAIAVFHQSSTDFTERNRFVGGFVARADGCITNPFDAGCVGATYTELRANACVNLDSIALSSGDLLAGCTEPDVIAVVCTSTGVTANPFNTDICGLDAANAYATEQEAFCKNPLFRNNSNCPNDAFNNQRSVPPVTGKDWEKAQGVGLRSVGTIGSGFLRIKEGSTEFDLGDALLAKAGQYSANLKDIIIGGVGLGGDVEDGFTLAIAPFPERVGDTTGVDTRFAGIFPTTNLGYPLAQTPQVGGFDVIVDWNATSRFERGFPVISDQSPFAPSISDFTLRVNLTNSTITGLIKTLANDPANHRYFVIDEQSYDEKGVITGTIDYRFYDEAVNFGNYKTATVLANDGAVEVGSTGGALTGLIGQEGAIAVFHQSEADGDNNFIGGFAARADGCIANPFGAGCDGNVYTQLRANACANSDEIARINGALRPACTADAIIELVCRSTTGAFANPFNTDICGADATTVYAAEQRSFCLNPEFIDSINCINAEVAICGTATAGDFSTKAFAFDDLCTSADYGYLRARVITNCLGDSTHADCAVVVGSVDVTACLADPYLADCPAVDFSVQRAARLLSCDRVYNAAICANTERVVCTGEENPFSPVCNHANAPDYSVAKNEYCQIRANSGISVCVSILNNPTAASWLRSQKFELQEIALNAPNRNQFLKATTTGFNLRGLDKVITGSLNLNTAEYLGAPISRDVLDGIVFGHGDINGRRRHYAGILAGTDLGAPLAGNVAVEDANVEWRGAFAWLFADETTVVTRDFILNINLNTRSLSARIARTEQGLEYFILAGKYAVNGVISGTVILAEETLEKTTTLASGILGGLIGRTGAVGAFHSDNTLQSKYFSGGFVAITDAIDFAYWAGNARRFTDVTDTSIPAIGFDIAQTPELPDSTAGLIQGGADGISVSQDPVARQEVINLTLGDNYSTATRDIIDFGGEAADGVSFGFVADDTLGVRANFVPIYAGLLSGTDLGAPITASATLNGRFGVAINSVDELPAFYLSNDFVLMVDFNLKTITSNIVNFGDYRFAIEATTFDPNGLITGVITDGADTPTKGVLTGLIGAEGALGVFASTGDW